jgi:hypothetical protein
MNVQTHYVELPRMNLGCQMNSVLSFTVGALSATTACTIGYILYSWLVAN